jgi:hypothetical protein
MGGTKIRIAFYPMEWDKIVQCVLQLRLQKLLAWPNPQSPWASVTKKMKLRINSLMWLGYVSRVASQISVFTAF